MMWILPIRHSDGGHLAAFTKYELKKRSFRLFRGCLSAREFVAESTVFYMSLIKYSFEEQMKFEMSLLRPHGGQHLIRPNA